MTVPARIPQQNPCTAKDWENEAFCSSAPIFAPLSSRIRAMGIPTANVTTCSSMTEITTGNPAPLPIKNPRNTPFHAVKIRATDNIWSGRAESLSCITYSVSQELPKNSPAPKTALVIVPYRNTVCITFAAFLYCRC